MINSSAPDEPGSVREDEAVEAIVRAGPSGAVALAGVTTAIVIALWFAFYLFVFLPRSA